MFTTASLTAVAKYETIVKYGTVAKYRTVAKYGTWFSGRRPCEIDVQKLFHAILEQTLRLE